MEIAFSGVLIICFRQSCYVELPNPVFDNTEPCPEDFKMYLEASYRCVPGNQTYFSFNVSNRWHFQHFQLDKKYSPLYIHSTHHTGQWFLCPNKDCPAKGKVPKRAGYISQCVMARYKPKYTVDTYTDILAFST